MAAQPFGHLAWDREDGLPELIIPGAQTSSLGDPPPSNRRVPVEVRVLGDGAAQVSMLSPTGVRAIRLAPARRVVAFQCAGRVIDMVVGVDGNSVALEQRASGLVAAHGIAADGRSIWTIEDVVPMDRKPRLLTDAAATVFVAGLGILMTVEHGQAAHVIAWAGGGEPLMDPHGNVGFVRYDPAQNTRSFVLLDPRTGNEISIAADADAWGILTRPIGIDSAGRVYGYSSGSLGRLSRDGSADWRVSLADLEADAQGGVSQHAASDRENDSAAGRVDVSLTRNDIRSPSISSVTAAGEVVTAVVGPDGVYVVGLSAL